MTAGAEIRVLLAEDDAAVRDALVELVGRDPGLELVAAVEDADQAIEAAVRERPDVALLDVRMPGGGGATAAREIRSRARETRVVALSAHDDRATVVEMLEAGAVGYVVKGGPIDDVLESIKRAAAGQASLSAEVTRGVIHELVDQLARRRGDEQRRRLVTERVRAALQDEAALSFLFQPICSLEGDGMIGAEALARFRGPPHRTPDRWFAEAGEVGMESELELLAVRRALEHMPRVPDAAYLSVNASPATVARPEFHDLLAAARADRVVVEITEHAPVRDYERMERTLAALRALGARVAIDDAGAGFASLRHILRFAPEVIKLDRSLISGIATDRTRQALAAGLISFADKIGATIVAEGVERPDELDALKDLGVRYAQGYFLAEPGPLPPGTSPPSATVGGDELDVRPATRRRAAPAPRRHGT